MEVNEMPTITMFSVEDIPKLEKAVSLLNGKKSEANWVSARQNKYNQDEIFIQYWHYEEIESALKRAFSEEDSYEIISVLKENGKDKILKRTYAFINYVTHTLEIYRGLDNRTNELLTLLERRLKTKFSSLQLSQEELVQVYKKYSSGLRKVTLKNQQTNEEIAITGKNINASQEFAEIFGYPWVLREISFRPKIKFMNEHNKYVVSLDGDRGTLKISSNEVFQWRPRFELRQIIFIISAVNGMMSGIRQAEPKGIANLDKKLEEPQRSSLNLGEMATQSRDCSFVCLTQP
jgi:hypothetical protein